MHVSERGHVADFGGARFTVRAVCSAAPGKDHDAYVVRRGAAAVADGATPLPEADDAETRRFAQRACELLVDHADRPVHDMIAGIIRDGKSAAAPLLQPSCALAAARVRGESLELVSLGDCLAVALLEGGTAVTAFDDRVAAFERPVEDHLGRLLGQGIGEAEALASARERIPGMRRRMNSPGGYWVLADDAAAADHVVHAATPLRDVGAVLLATDGFVRLWNVFGVATSPADLAGLAGRKGLLPLIDELRTRESQPGNLLRHPRLSPQDDATAVLLTRVG